MSIFGNTYNGVPNPIVPHEHPYPTRYHGPLFTMPQASFSYTTRPRDVPVQNSNILGPSFSGNSPDGLGKMNLNVDKFSYDALRPTTQDIYKSIHCKNNTCSFMFPNGLSKRLSCDSDYMSGLDEIFYKYVKEYMVNISNRDYRSAGMSKAMAVYAFMFKRVNRVVSGHCIPSDAIPNTKEAEREFDEAINRLSTHMKPAVSGLGVTPVLFSSPSGNSMLDAALGAAVGYLTAPTPNKMTVAGVGAVCGLIAGTAGLIGAAGLGIWMRR